MSCACGTWPCGECGTLVLMHEFVGNVCHDCAAKSDIDHPPTFLPDPPEWMVDQALGRPVVVVDLVDLVCEACDREFEATRPDEDEPFIICGPCAIPA